jgi:hypothetical protein
MKKIMIFGGLPEPIGGVTNFIYRIAAANLVDKVVDVYFGKRKRVPPSFTGIIFNYNNLINFFLAYIFRRVPTKDVDAIHFNFSTPRSLIYVCFLPKRRSEFYLMLHHGQLNSSAPNFLMRIFLKKFDKIFYLSERQNEFYVKHNFPSSKLHKKSSYLPVKEIFFENVDADVKAIVDSNAEFSLISGYCNEIYNHHWVIKLFSEVELNKKLLVFLYGEINNSYFLKLNEIAQENPRVYFFLDRSSDTFNYALSRSSVYLRPNSRDSFGIAVADAVNFGVKVLASNVCDRYPGSYIFQPDCYESFVKAYNALKFQSSSLKISHGNPDDFRFQYN